MRRTNVYSYMHNQKIRRIRIKNSTAYMIREGQQEYELMPLEKNPIYGFLLLTDLILAQMGHEDFFMFYEPIPDSEMAFKGMVCIYSMDLGPAIAGLRVDAYDTEEDMVEDACMISRAVARKAAISEIPFGGAQVVVDFEKPQNVLYNKESVFPLLEHIGSLIEEFEGKLILAPDLNASMLNMHIAMRKTSHVICNLNEDQTVEVEAKMEEPGSPNGSGDPTPFTAQSVYNALKVAFAFQEGLEEGQDVSLRNKKILIIGLGKCGLALVDYLVKEGAKIYGADIDDYTCRVMEEIYGVKIIARNREEVKEAHKFECDAILPCATGGLISDKRLHDFRTKIIVGAANNQLNQDRDAILLHELGVLWIPDFLANCGGLINAVQEVQYRISKGRPDKVEYRKNYKKDKVRTQVDEMKSSVWEILKTSQSENLSPYEVAVAKAQLKMQDRRKLRWFQYMAKKSQ